MIRRGVRSVVTGSGNPGVAKRQAIDDLVEGHGFDPAEAADMFDDALAVERERRVKAEPVALEIVRSPEPAPVVEPTAEPVSDRGIAPTARTMRRQLKGKLGWFNAVMADADLDLHAKAIAALVFWKADDVTYTAELDHAWIADTMKMRKANARLGSVALARAGWVEYTPGRGGRPRKEHGRAHPSTYRLKSP